MLDNARSLSQPLTEPPNFQAEKEASSFQDVCGSYRGHKETVTQLNA